MKIILKIARAELRNLFYSPVAWFVIVSFYVFVAATYFGKQLNAVSMQEVLQANRPDYLGFEKGLTNIMILPVVQVVLQFLYLFIPLLTMGLMNREFSNGTFRLLYSSPVTPGKIVLGKYLGMVLFNFVFLLAIGVVMRVVGFNIENPETGWYLSILLGLFLLVNTYAAIGLFISCLTQYQVVAAVITFFVFFLLSIASRFGAQYDFIRDVTHAISLSGKLNGMLFGLITSKDVLYFLIIISLFVALSIIKIKSTQESSKRGVVFYRYSIVALVALMLGYFTSRPRYVAYLDTTHRQTNTLHPTVQEVVKNLDGSPLTVTLYTNLLGNNVGWGLPQNRNSYLWHLWQPYIRFYPNIQFKYEYYYGVPDGDSSIYKTYPGKSLEEIAAIQAEVVGVRKSLFKNAKEFENLADLKRENMRIVIKLEYKGRTAYAKTFDDDTFWPQPTHVAGALQQLLSPRNPKVYFLTGHYERDPFQRSPRDYANHTTYYRERGALGNRGVDIDTLSLVHNDVPSDADILVIADPRSDYSEIELERINNYIRNGGNAILHSESDKKHILAPVFKELGIEVEEGVIVHRYEDEMPHLAYNAFTPSANFMAKESVMEAFQIYGRGGARVLNEAAANLLVKEVNGFKVDSVVVEQGSEITWIKKGRLVVDSAAPVFTPVEGDVKRDNYLLAAKLTRKINNKEQRIVVTGDADPFSNKRYGLTSAKLAFYSWCLDNKYPVYAHFKLPEDRLFKISSKRAENEKQLFVYGIPILLVIGASILLVRRKRK